MGASNLRASLETKMGHWAAEAREHAERSRASNRCFSASMGYVTEKVVFGTCCNARTW